LLGVNFGNAARCDGNVLKCGKSEGFFGFAVVEVGGEVRVELADLIEEPSVQPDGILRVEGAVVEGLGVEAIDPPVG
jgi:hypothetical protein